MKCHVQREKKESSKNLCINCWSVTTCPLWQMCYCTSIIADQSVRSLHDGFWINHWSSRTYVRCNSHTIAVSAFLFCGESAHPRRPSVCTMHQRDDEFCLSSAITLVICGTKQKTTRYFSCSELHKKNKWNTITNLWIFVIPGTEHSYQYHIPASILLFVS